MLLRSPPFRALHPPRHHQTPAMRASFPIIPRPHCGRCFPSRNMSHLPAADVNSPSPNIPHLPAADVYSPSPFMEMGVADRPGERSTPRHHPPPALRSSIVPPLQIYHICPRQMSTPHLQLYHICQRQMSTPHLHLWRGGGR